MIEAHFSSPAFDVLLIAEGTYPFVRGGVAKWISDLIQHMPHYTFGVIFLGGYSDIYDEYMYPIPDNMVYLKNIYLFEPLDTNQKRHPVTPEAQENLAKLHANFSASHLFSPGLKDPLLSLDATMCPHTGFDFMQFIRSPESWDFIVNKYKSFSSNPSFINYFWNVYNMHVPLWCLHEILNQLPTFKLIHSNSTGYAGLLSVMIKQKTNKPFLLTEHGIYTKERTIELLQSHMFTKTDMLLSENKGFIYEHDLWLRFFRSLARMAYQEANKIISLFKGAEAQQILDGADPAKTCVIANGVDIDLFKPLRRTPEMTIPKTIAFVGRFVRIKDIKMLIRATQAIHEQDHTIRVLFKTFGDIDQNYLEECMDYIDFLELTPVIEFVKEGGMMEVLEQAGVLVLTSISEGMPLVMLESLAAGIPVIATDVGACREMIEGINLDDQQLGVAGAIVPISDAKSLARETLNLLHDKERWFRASMAGIKRIEQRYDQDLVVTHYEKLYQEMISWQA